MISVLVVDDSAVVRKVLSDELSKHDGIEVVGVAVDPYVARDKIMRLHPDVITLDIEMPRMDGLSFLALLMEHQPMPVVVVSSLTPENSELALRALDLGAVEVVPKPGSTYSIPDIPGRLVRAIRAAAMAQVAQRRVALETAHPPTRTANIPLRITHKLLAIGASTGGTTAIQAVLTRLPANAPGAVIVQHMPGDFTAAFARRLNERCEMEVREARDDDMVAPGLALVAPGGRHILLRKSGTRLRVSLKDGPPVHYQRPSVMCCSSPWREVLGQTLSECCSQAWGPMAHRACWHCRGAARTRLPRTRRPASCLACPGRPPNSEPQGKCCPFRTSRRQSSGSVLTPTRSRPRRLHRLPVAPSCVGPTLLSGTSSVGPTCAELVEAQSCMP